MVCDPPHQKKIIQTVTDSPRKCVPTFAASRITTASSTTMVGTNPCAGGTGEDRETREAQEHPDTSMA